MVQNPCIFLGLSSVQKQQEILKGFNLNNRRWNRWWRSSKETEPWKGSITAKYLYIQPTSGLLVWGVFNPQFRRLHWRLFKL